MRDNINNKKAVALFVVLATLFIVIALAKVLLNIFLSHGRLTQHQIGRIQAYYASMAGINYAYESLRTGAWTIPASSGSYSWTLCNGCAIDEKKFPPAVSNVTVTITGLGGSPPIAQISAKATYATP